MYSIQEREAQATALLAAAYQPDVREQLLRYALKLTRDADEADELLHQVLLDVHDHVQLRGFAGRTVNEYKFYVLRCLQNAWVDECRRRGRLVPLPAGVEEYAAEVADPSLHEAREVERVLQEGFSLADRAAFRLHADGYSSRKIEEMTGRCYRTISRLVADMKSYVRRELLPEGE